MEQLAQILLLTIMAGFMSIPFSKVGAAELQSRLSLLLVWTEQPKAEMISCVAIVFSYVTHAVMTHMKKRL